MLFPFIIAFYKWLQLFGTMLLVSFSSITTTTTTTTTTTILEQQGFNNWKI